MNILWHMPTLQRSGCGLSHRALRLARELASVGHKIVFSVALDKANVERSRIEEFAVELLPVETKEPLHWALQSTGRSAAARRLAVRLSDRHDLFVTCQPEMVWAYRRLKPQAKIVFVCGGTALLHEPRERSEQARQPFMSRAAFVGDRLLKRRLERKAFQAADVVVFDSRTTRSLVIRTYGIDETKCRAVIGAVDTADFTPIGHDVRASARKTLGIDPCRSVVAWTGRLSPEKNLSLLIRAAARCQSAPILLLVGDGPLRADLVRLCDGEGVAARTVWPGLVADVRPFLQAADVFAFPSCGESFGGSLVEAMACGLPCLALSPDGKTIRTASAEILEDGVSGRLVAPPTVEALAGALDRLLADASLRARLGRGARARVEREFTWQRAGRELIEAIAALAPRAAPYAALPMDGCSCALQST